MSAPADIPTDVRARLLKARDIGLGNVAEMPISVTRDLNQAIATIANEFHALRCPQAALDDALKLCRLLMRAQALSGQLDGTYPCDRYAEEPANGN